jgi:mannose-1-phosphate guanylyltransferase/mannose-6-phosphate isomerase
MAGGSGTRFWPRSRARVPKQLLPILGGRSMVQETVARLGPLIARDRVLVVTGRLQAGALRAQLPRLGRRAVLVEPQGRNTAPAIALAALYVARHAPDAVMVVLPADHAISPPAVYRADLRVALGIAERTGALVTFGIPPTHPETGYGYIRPGAAIGNGGRTAWVDAFIEKPDRTRAERLLAAGGVLWNSGIFAWRVDAILAALRTHLPTLMRTLEPAAARGGPALARAYRRLTPVSIDTGVLERAARVAVVRARFRWSDVGSWSALESFWAGRGNGPNAVSGRAVVIDSRGCVVDNPRRLVALLGVEDLVVVDTPDALLVCRKSRAQDVRLVVDQLRRQGLARYL